MSQMTLVEMVKEVQEISPQADDLVISYLNRHYDRMAMARDWDDLRGRIFQNLSTIASRNYLAFPEDCAQPIKLIDVDNDYILVRRDLEQLEEDFASTIDATGGGPIIHYAAIGRMATMVPLSAADELSVVTEFPADSAIDIVVTGLRNDPEVRDREVITTHATTPEVTSVDGLVTWREGWSIMTISTASGLKGYVQIHEQSTTGNVVAVLTEHVKSSRYFVIQLQNAPSSSDNLHLIYKKRVLPMKDDADVPMIPISEALIEATIASCRRSEEQYSQARDHDSQANSFLAAVISEQDGQSRKSSRSSPAAARWRRKMRGR